MQHEVAMATKISGFMISTGRHFYCDHHYSCLPHPGLYVIKHELAIHLHVNSFIIYVGPGKIDLQFIVTACMVFEELNNNFMFHYLSHYFYYASGSKQYSCVAI